MTPTRSNLIMDQVAVVLSAACMVHCLALPLVLTLFPMLLSLFPVLGSGLLQEQNFHAMLLVFVLPASAFALVVGCRQHHRYQAGWIGLAGLGILTVTALWGHDLVGIDGERLVTSLGGTVLAVAHILNYRYCRSADCTHEH